MRIRRRAYLARDAPWQDVFDYIEMFYNPNRKHTNNGIQSPIDYEIKQRKMSEAGVYRSRGTSVYIGAMIRAFSPNTILSPPLILTKVDTNTLLSAPEAGFAAT